MRKVADSIDTGINLLDSRREMEGSKQSDDGHITAENIATQNILRSYTNNAPKIMLETISARTATIILVVTYITFALAFLFDLRSTMNGFTDGNKMLSSASCDSQNISVGVSDSNYGCTLQRPNNVMENMDLIWVGHVHNFENIISVALQAKYKNITSVSLNGTSIDDDEILEDIKIKYDVDLYACYRNENCGSASDPNSHWKVVLQEDDREVVVGDVYNDGDNAATVQILPNTFQNQETLPDNGRVKSYLIYVTYHSDQPYFTTVSDMEYKFANINRKSYLGARVLLQFCVVFTIGVLVFYVWALRQRYTSILHALPEQRWLLFYIAALILFQNPIYCVITWKGSPSADMVYAAYVLDAISQSSLFTLWLIYADGLRRQFGYWTFYLPKIGMGFLIFITMIVVLTLQFPTITTTLHRSPVEAVTEWSYNTKISFIAFSMSFLLLLCVWTAWWFYTLWHTGRALGKLPYMSTRYLQLWFRFFSLQATLVTLYYVFQYFVTIYYIFHYTPDLEHTTLENIVDNINTLFRQQSLLFGKVFFLTVYAFILAFFFLPAGLLDEKAAALASLAAMYVVSESEIKPAYLARLKAINKTKTLSQLTTANPNVFCVDLALNLLEVAYQAYNDPRNYITESGYGVMAVEQFGYVLLNHAHDKEHDTVCFIFRHLHLPRIVIAFRGTCTKKHWADNLNYTPRHIDISAMKLRDLDEVDGLEVKGMQIPAREGSGDHASVFSDDMDSDEEGAAVGMTSGTDDPDAEGETPRLKRTLSFRRSMAQVSQNMTAAAYRATDATTDMFTMAAQITPGLEHTVNTHIHSGFWEAYLTVREFIHTVVRQELLRRPSDIICTGHSLGGALATLAAEDLTLHTISRINNYLRATRARGSHSMTSVPDEGDVACPPLYTGGMGSEIKRVRMCMYNFGTPRVGNWHFATEYNRIVPNSFRIVVDGDIVSGVPKGNYKHIGTEIIVDPLGAGSIIIDPSFVEKFLRTHNKTSMSVHSLVFYRRGLQGVKAATEYTRAHAKQSLAKHGDGTELENALISEQVQLAYASGEAAVKYAIEAEERINSQLAAAYADDPSVKHIREVEETNAMAETVTNMQKTHLEKMYDRSKGMYAAAKRKSSALLGLRAAGTDATANSSTGGNEQTSLRGPDFTMSPMPTLESERDSHTASNEVDIEALKDDRVHDSVYVTRDTCQDDGSENVY